MIFEAKDANSLTSGGGGGEREARREETSGDTDSVELGDELGVQGEASEWGSGGLPSLGLSCPFVDLK